MARRAAQVVLRWSLNRGRNDWDIPSDVPDGMTCESMNVALERNTLGKRRLGSAAQTFTGDSFTGYNSIARFVPKAGETAAEIFIVSDDGTTKILRVAAGSAASNLTLKDNVTNDLTARFAVLNNKLYIAYDSAVNRLHVFSPDESTSTVRRVGLAAPGVASVANTGSGSYAATIRYYRVQWRTKSGSTILRQSNLGTAVSFTPDGNGTHARVTIPSLASEGETHWAIYGSADGELYYELTELAVGTTTYDDNEDPGSYSDNDPAPDEGAFTPPPSAKFILSTGERLVLFGAHESTAGDAIMPKNGRVWFTPVLDTTDTDDDERISNTLEFQGWIDIGRNSGAEDRGLGGPVDNCIFVFQSKGTYMLVPTGQADQPFRRVVFHQDIGAVSQESIFMGEDEAGRPALYWLDPVRGPYRYGAGGLQWLGYDVQTLWKTVNQAAATRVAVGCYDPEERCAVFWLATGASDVCNEAIKFYVRYGIPEEAGLVRGGWVRKAEASASSWRCCALLPLTIGATMSRGLKPYTGNATALRRWNEASVNQDAGTNYQAYVTSKSWDMDALDRFKTLEAAYLQASAQSAVTITQTLTRNFGDETARTATILLTPVGSATRISKKFDDARLKDATHIQVTLGDGAAQNVTWTLDEWRGHLTADEVL